MATDELSKAYKELLGRDIGSEGRSYWSKQMASGHSISDVRSGIKKSAEYKARSSSSSRSPSSSRTTTSSRPTRSSSSKRSAQSGSSGDLNSIYNEMLGRDIGDAGTKYWSKALASGQTLDDIRRNIASSDEYKNRALLSSVQSPQGWNDPANQQARFDDGQTRATEYLQSGGAPTVSYSDNGNNEDFLNAVYLNETGRKPDEQGMAYWQAMMDGGMTRDEVIAGFNQSQEGQGYDNPIQEDGNQGSEITAAKAEFPYEKTAAGLLDQILSKDSPLMQRAATQGRQAANSRGLLNSSMAAGAAQGAMIDRASPLAMQDSRSYLNNAKFNASQENTFRLSEMEADQALEKLYATSNANAWGVMANNITDLVGQASAQIERIQMNPDIAEADKAELIQQVLDNRNTDIQFQQALYQSLAQDLINTGLFPDGTGVAA